MVRYVDSSVAWNMWFVSIEALHGTLFPQIWLVVRDEPAGIERERERVVLHFPRAPI